MFLEERCFLHGKKRSSGSQMASPARQSTKPRSPGERTARAKASSNTYWTGQPRVILASLGFACGSRVSPPRNWRPLSSCDSSTSLTIEPSDSCGLLPVSSVLVWFVSSTGRWKPPASRPSSPSPTLLPKAPVGEGAFYSKRQLVLFFFRSFRFGKCLTNLPETFSVYFRLIVA